MDDIGAVMDAGGSQRAALVGASEGGSQCTLFAATYPERTRALILCGAVATNVWSPQTPWAPTDELYETYMGVIEREWGGPVGLPLFAPSKIGDKRFEDPHVRLIEFVGRCPWS